MKVKLTLKSVEGRNITIEKESEELILYRYIVKELYQDLTELSGNMNLKPFHLIGVEEIEQ